MISARAISLLSVVAVLSGCANLNKLQQIPITTYNAVGKVDEAGAVYLWPPYSSAALVDGKGNRCVLIASGAKSIDASSEAAFKIGKALEKIEGLETSIKNTLVESFTKLSAADSRAAFADVALFHLCMLDQNGTFAEFKEDKQGNKVDHKFKAHLVMDAYLKVIEAAKELKQ